MLLPPVSRASAQLLANIAEVVTLPIVNIQLIYVVEVLGRAEEASRVLRIYVPLQRLIPIKLVLKHQHWLLLHA